MLVNYTVTVGCMKLSNSIYYESCLSQRTAASFTKGRRNTAALFTMGGT